jgi:hypothetical protein
MVGRSLLLSMGMSNGATTVDRVGPYTVFAPFIAVGGSLIGHAMAQSRDELYAKCRRAIFRKYGQPGVQYNRAPGRRVLPSKFVIGAIDRCVASGGRSI